jgi:autotransporter-associated beta strand protein
MRTSAELRGHSIETAAHRVATTRLIRRVTGIIICFQLLVLGATGVQALVLTQTVSQASSTTSNWNHAIWGTPAAIPASANIYVIPDNTYVCRTPNILTNSADLTFGGNWITNYSSQGLYFQHGNVPVSANITLVAGTITTDGGPNGTTNGPMSGTLVNSGNSRFLVSPTAASPYNYWLMPSLALKGSGSLLVQVFTNAFFLSCDASGYTGSWTNSGGRMEIWSGTTNPLGSGKVNLAYATNSLTFNSTNNLVISNAISGLGPIIKLNSGSVRFAVSNSFAGGVTVGSSTVSGGIVDLRNSYGLGNSSKTITITRSELQLRGNLDIPAPITFSIAGDTTVADPGSGLMPIRSVSDTNIIEGGINVNAGTGTGEIGCDSGQLTINGNVQLITTSRPLYLSGANGVGIINGTVSDASGGAALGLTKRGNGTWLLNGPAAYTGDTVINGGTLGLGAGSTELASASIQLASNAVFDVRALFLGQTLGGPQTLKGNGTVLGDVRVYGTISPASNTGTGIGALAVSGALTLSSKTVMEINRGASPNADRIAGGSIALGGTLSVTNLGAALQAGDSFNLFDGPLSYFFVHTNLPALASTNLFWDASLLNSQGIIRVGSTGPVQPTILPPSVSGTNFVLQVQSQVGSNYVVEATLKLGPASWTGIQTNPGGGVLTFTIPITPATPKRFFRVRVQ